MSKKNRKYIALFKDFEGSKKIYLSMSFLCVLTYGYSQQTFDTANSKYDVLQERIENKDTLVTFFTNHYKCSESLSGRIDYYYEADKLILINHLYKQGFENLWTSEDYFIIEDALRIKTSISEETIHINTVEKRNEQGASSISVEKVIEITEQRMFFENNFTTVCYERKHAQNVTDWDAAYFNSLELKETNCIEDNEDILDKYKLLRKAEKKLIQGYSRKNSQCIFYMW